MEFEDAREPLSDDDKWAAPEPRLTWSQWSSFYQFWGKK